MRVLLDTHIFIWYAKEQDKLSKDVLSILKMLLQQAITAYRTSKARGDLEYNKKMFAEAKERYDKACEAYVRFADGNQKVSVRQRQSKLEDEMQLQRSIYQQLAS